MPNKKAWAGRGRAADRGQRIEPGQGIEDGARGRQQLIQLGEANIVLTGGVENMSQAPHVLRGLRAGLKMGNVSLEDSLLEGLRDS